MLGEAAARGSLDIDKAEGGRRARHARHPHPALRVPQPGTLEPDRLWDLRGMLIGMALFRLGVLSATRSLAR